MIKLLLQSGFSIAAALLTYYAVSGYGAALTSDSVGYVIAARSILAGTGLPLVFHTPFYPMMLVLASYISTVDPAAIASWLNIVLLVGVVCMVIQILYLADIRFDVYVIIGLTAVLLFSTPLAYISRYALSELPFIALVLLFLLLLSRFQKQPTFYNLGFLAVIAGMASMTRYIGIVLIPLGMISIWRSTGVMSLRRRLLYLGVFAVCGSAPLALWLLRNLFMYNSMAGERTPSTISILDNIERTFRVIGNGFLPRYRFHDLTWLAPLAGGALSIAPLIAATIASKLVKSVLPLNLMLFFYLHTGALILVSSAVAIDPINDRLLAPSAIALGMLLLMGISALRSLKTGKYTSRGLTVAIVLFLILWIGPSGIEVVASAARGSEVGFHGFSHKRWRDDPLIRFLNTHITDLPSVIFVNEPAALYFHTTMFESRNDFVVLDVTQLDDSILLEKYSSQKKAFIVFEGYPNNYQELFKKGAFEPFVFCREESFTTGRFMETK